MKTTKKSDIVIREVVQDLTDALALLTDSLRNSGTAPDNDFYKRLERCRSARAALGMGNTPHSATTIKYLAVDKVNRTATPVEEADLESFFLGRRLMNYIVVLDEKVAVNLDAAVKNRVDLCDVRVLANHLKWKRGLKVTLS